MVNYITPSLLYSFIVLSPVADAGLEIHLNHVEDTSSTVEYHQRVRKMRIFGAILIL